MEYQNGTTGISVGHFEKLSTLAICGGWNDDLRGNNGFNLTARSNINDLSCLKNISDSLKKSVNKLYVHNNKLEGDLSFLEGFSNVKLLSISTNDITTLKGIKSCSLLEKLYLFNLKNLGIDDTLEYENENNSLYELQFLKSLLCLDEINGDVGECKILSYIKNCDKLTDLFIGMDSFDIGDVRDIKEFINSRKVRHQLNAKYSLAILSDNTTSIILDGLSIDVEEFRGLKGHTGIKKAGFHQMKLTRDDVEIDKEEFTSVFTEIVGSWKQVERVDCCYTNLLNLNFIRDKEKEITNTPNLIALSILNTSITDLSNIQYVELKCLGIDNSSIDLSLIENYIGNMR